MENRDPKNVHLMRPNDLKYVAERVGLINDLCGEREVKMAFNLSKEPIVDEISNEDIMKIRYLEFLEAFARIADKSSIPQFTKVI